ncbi:MAG TPA: CGNR zinc finger domain-containing protein [Solirubrobacteraceae bacterium]
MPVTPTAADMRLDGGHPALDLVNTVYGQVGAPPEHDVLSTPEDLVTFARRVDMAGARTPASPAALAAARRLRDALDAVLHAHLHGAAAPPGAAAAVADAVRAALAAAHLAPAGDARPGGSVTAAGPARSAGDARPAGAGPVPSGPAYAWTWPAADPLVPVHRLALAAAALLQSPDELARLHRCAGCRWLFLDRSRGAGRRWCSMADCGTEAKKRRYVARRRERRARQL